MSIEIIPVLATNPVVTEPVASKTYDVWFLSEFRLVSNSERKFDAQSFWRLGRYKEDGTPELSDKVAVSTLNDILSDDNLINNPEIAAVTPAFLGALEAVAKRQNAI